MIKMRFIYCASIIFLAMAGQSCRVSSGNNEAVVAGRDTVNVFVLHTAPIGTTLQLPAELKPYNRAELYPKVQGYVREMKVDIGSVVSRGQVLAILEAPELKARYAEALASQQAIFSKYQISKDQWRRLQLASREPNAVAPFDLEKSLNQMRADSAQYEAGKQLVNANRELVDYLVVRAPFNGKVTQRNADPGDLVGTSTLVFTVEDQSVFRLQVPVPEKFGSAVPEEKINFITDIYPGKKFEAVLARKSGAIDQKTRTELWEFETKNQNGILKSGMFVYAVIELNRPEPGFLVPQAAVVTTLEKKFVNRIRNGQVEWIDVRQGFLIEKQIEIIGDIAEGDTLLSRGTDEIKIAAKVIPRMVQ